jgi:hypothetical protein
MILIMKNMIFLNSSLAKKVKISIYLKLLKDLILVKIYENFKIGSWNPRILRQNSYFYIGFLMEKNLNIVFLVIFSTLWEIYKANKSIRIMIFWFFFSYKYRKLLSVARYLNFDSIFMIIDHITYSMGLWDPILKL